MFSDAHIQEQKRLESLDQYDILDTPPEESFDRITRLTRLVFDVPMSTISLIDGHRQWFKSRQGVAACETPRGPAFCNIVIRESRPLIVPDTLADDRFAQNPFVVGQPHLRFYAGVPLGTPDGYNIGTLCAMDTKPRVVGTAQVEALSDLAQIVMSELELRKLATTDGLTGALSRRAFWEAAARAFALAVRHGHDLSCIYFDLDHFKAINDANGHAVGDLVLARTVATCRAKLRRSDLLGRIGGKEFAILLPHTGRSSAMTVAEKIRRAIARQRIPAPSGPIAPTASCGVASIDMSVVDIDTLFQRADAALYSAKAAGRNRCIAWMPVGRAEPNVRRRVLKAGRISFNAGRSTIDCTVRSLSDAGAGIDVVNVTGVPDRFKLHIESDGLHRLCRIVAKTDKHIEVQFEEAASVPMLTAGLATVA